MYGHEYSTVIFEFLTCFLRLVVRACHPVSLLILSSFEGKLKLINSVKFILYKKQTFVTILYFAEGAVNRRFKL